MKSNYISHESGLLFPSATSDLEGAANKSTIRVCMSEFKEMTLYYTLPNRDISLFFIFICFWDCISPKTCAHREVQSNMEISVEPTLHTPKWSSIINKCIEK